MGRTQGRKRADSISIDRHFPEKIPVLSENANLFEWLYSVLRFEAGFGIGNKLPGYIVIIWRRVSQSITDNHAADGSIKQCCAAAGHKNIDIRTDTGCGK